MIYVKITDNTAVLKWSAPSRSIGVGRWRSSLAFFEVETLTKLSE